MKHPDLLIRDKTIRLPEDPDHEYYLPGYLLPKIGFLAFTGLIVCIALLDIVPKLWIIATGESVRAEVVEVLRTNADGNVLTFTNDAEARNAYEENDRIPIFHNTVAFRLADGTLHRSLLPRGSRIQAPYNILDASGLPNIVLVSARPQDPGKIVVPLSLSTWFFPGIILAFGLAGMIPAGLFLRRATVPIQVPHLRTPQGENLAKTDDDSEPDMEAKKKAP